MKKLIALTLALSFCLILAACGGSSQQTYTPTNQTPSVPITTDPEATDPTVTVPTTEPTVTEPVTTEPATTEPTATEPTVTEPTTPAPTEPTVQQHSGLYIDGVSTDNVVRYFSEVCLDAEFSSTGNPTVIQKWVTPIIYKIHGTYTEQDLQVLSNFCAYLNSIPGFPGIRAASEQENGNLQIYFCTSDEMVDLMGSNYAGCDGGVTYWYHTATNDIYEATICIRNDIDQYVRNSVIKEEIYNGLGATQDTSLRSDSIIYSGYSTPQSLTAIDKLIITLLYHPNIRLGMNSTECETAIRNLYY